MQEQDHIENLFKETFRNYEAEVNPNAWMNIQGGIHSAAGGAASAAAKLAIGKLIAGASLVVAVAGSIWYFSGNEKPAPVSSGEKHTTEMQAPVPAAAEQQPGVKSQMTNTSSVHQSAPGSDRYNSSAAHFLNPSRNHISTPGQSASGEAQVQENSSDNSSPDQPVHKYGPATRGDGGMMRGSQAQYATTGISDHPSEPEDPGAEAVVQAANIFVSTSSGDAPLHVKFINQGNAISLSWDFGDGAESSETAPEHVFEKPGKYEVILTAKNASSSDKDKVTIEVKSISGIAEETPNVFSPNGDGIEDFFFFEMKNIATIGVAIISQRTKQMVAKWNTLDGNWDGKIMNGEEAPAGVYYYAIQAIGTDGVSHSKNGVLTLVR